MLPFEFATRNLNTATAQAGARTDERERQGALGHMAARTASFYEDQGAKSDHFEYFAFARLRKAFRVIIRHTIHGNRLDKGDSPRLNRCTPE